MAANRGWNFADVFIEHKKNIKLHLVTNSEV